MPDHNSPNKIAAKVIEKVGGVSAVSEITGDSESWIHRWKYTKKAGGTEGEVPQKAQRKLIASGVVSPSDFFEVVT